MLKKGEKFVFEMLDSKLVFTNDDKTLDNGEPLLFMEIFKENQNGVFEEKPTLDQYIFWDKNSSEEKLGELAFTMLELFRIFNNSNKMDNWLKK